MRMIDKPRRDSRKITLGGRIMGGLAWIGLIVWRFRVSFLLSLCLSVFFSFFLESFLEWSILLDSFFNFCKKNLGSLHDAYIQITAGLFIAIDIIGQCPPQAYDPSSLPNGGVKTNPYWFFYGPGQSYTESSLLDSDNGEESFASVDAGADDSASVLRLGNHSLLSLFLSKESKDTKFGTGTLAEAETALSVDDPPILSSTDPSNNVFVLSDSSPFLLSTDGGSNNNNLPDNMDFTGSTFVSDTLEGGQEDDSFFV